ncbi:MAG: lipoyl(octanoyl) transferase LipB [Bdellovibrionaceae bacterium]|nr:lipoyl(octanoyl) transferase LipB [Pseudobdellovibrionaceae bacterium]
MSFTSRYLGLCSYQQVALEQQSRAGRIRGTSEMCVLGMEFESVITLGVRGDQSQDVLFERSEAKAEAIPVVQTDRGGQATLHTPGQLVIYPMMDLKVHGIGVRDFVCMVVKATSAVLKGYGITSFSGPAPGLYTSQGKIAFLGIRVDQGVVRHGLAINVCNDLSYFASIRSCGVNSARVDRVSNYGLKDDLETIFKKWTTEFEAQKKLLQRANDFCDLQSEQEPLSIKDTLKVRI